MAIIPPSKAVDRNRKFEELLIYIAERSQVDPRFGAIKLNKILYYADVEAYRSLGHSISGDEYQHLSEGPAPRRLLPTRNILEEEGAIERAYVPYFSGVQQRVVPRRSPDLSVFTAEEIAIVDRILEQLFPFDGAQLSEMTHREFGYRITKDRETIPYRTSWISLEPLSQEQVAEGQAIAAKYGLLAD